MCQLFIVRPVDLVGSNCLFHSFFYLFTFCCLDTESRLQILIARNEPCITRSDLTIKNQNCILLFSLKMGVRLVPKRGCLLTLAYYAFPRRYEFGERRRNDTDRGKPKKLGGKPVPVPLCSSQIPRGLARARTRASAVRGPRLTT
jgi:hypothetical protein